MIALGFAIRRALAGDPESPWTSEADQLRAHGALGKWPKPKDVMMVWRPGSWKNGERIHTAVPEWWPSNSWPRNRRAGFRDRPYILKLKSSGRSHRFYVGVPGARLRDYSGEYFATLAAACAFFDKVIGFNAARVAFALSHRCVRGKWVRR